MGVEDSMGLFSDHTASTNTGAANRAKLKNAGYGGVRFRDTKGEGKSGGKKIPRGPRWSDAGIPTGGTKPAARPAGAQTTAEVAASRVGVASTAKNMGSLAVQYRADEATAIKAGELTDRNKRDQKIIDERRGTGEVGVPQGNTAMDVFKKDYWKAREVWAEDKGAYSGIVPSGSEGSHSQSTDPRRPQRTEPRVSAGLQAVRGLSTARAPKAGVRSNSPYGLF